MRYTQKNFSFNCNPTSISTVNHNHISRCTIASFTSISTLMIYLFPIYTSSMCVPNVEMYLELTALFLFVCENHLNATEDWWHTSTLHPATGHHTMKHRAFVAKWEATLRQTSLAWAQCLEVLWRLWTNIWEQLRKGRTVCVLFRCFSYIGNLKSFL